ncbi:MAG: flagellar motor switch protein FliG [Phycisphaerae bacterium]|nr:flagellar motor switch protein FliG [Phycisphaerae bacterium]
MAGAKKGRSQALADEGPQEYTGQRKVAVFLLAVGPAVAGKLMRNMDRETVEDLTREIASLGVVPPEKSQAIVEEFYNVALAKQYANEGGLNYAKMVLEQALPKEEAVKVMQQIEHQVHQQPFSFLQKAESENLLTFMQDEHPQTIALILAHLPSSKGSEILAGLPPAKQIEVVTRVANMEQTNPEVIREVEMGLEQRLSGIVSQQFQKVGGVEAVAEMLNLADRATEKGILETLEAEDPELVEQIRRLMFVFEDILLVNDKGIQSVLKEIDHDQLALALKTASEEMKEKIFKNMSERAALLIKEEMDYMGPVRLSDVEGAQQKIVDVVRRLEDAGEIILQGRGGDTDIVV